MAFYAGKESFLRKEFNYCRKLHFYLTIGFCHNYNSLPYVTLIDQEASTIRQESPPV